MFKFRIPNNYNAWCMLCSKGFMTIEELGEHNRTSVEEHNFRSGKKPKQAATQPGSTVHEVGCTCGFCKLGTTKA